MEIENNSSDMDLEDNVKKRKSNRTSNFNVKETKLLLDLIETYKLYILNYSCAAAVTQAKERAWAKMAHELNSKQIGPKRNPEHLKSKWDRLKSRSKNVTKETLARKDEIFRTLHNRVVELMQFADSVESDSVDISDELLDIPASIENGNGDQKDENSCDVDSLEIHLDNNSFNIGEGNLDNLTRPRGQKFSPSECSLLLQCARPEKKYIFTRDGTARALQLKNRAWDRIADNFNKLSPTRRSSKMLREKFKKLKNRARQISSINSSYKSLPVNHEKDVNPVKIEVDLHPVLKREASDDGCMDEDPSARSHSPYNADDSDFDDADNDPLSTMNCDFGNGSTHEEGMKLKNEILKVQLENAKLEQKRLAQTLEEEKSARESRAIECALRVRAARLEAIAAARKFPPRHPALQYSSLEDRAQAYLEQFEDT